ncbi:unnamed protein product [Cuscuta europaea]|uniref:Uncharacterized protein n=1 Tax=Cuscuta europaea TaxID=41803 RepID=A0A9P1E1P1_CUSEU|nr:unnamed protein product [Cuscuta europaea]
METVAAAAVPQPTVSPQIVGNSFVDQYYNILHLSPEIVYRFYQDSSKLGRPEEDGSMSCTTTMKAINEKILSLHYDDLRAEIKSIDAQESYNGGVSVLVTGYLTGKDNQTRSFSQSFFLAPQDHGGYFVLNDMLRYVETVHQHDKTHIPVVDIIVPSTAEPSSLPVEENHVLVHDTPSAEEPNGEVDIPDQNRDVPTVKEEVPVAEVINEVPDDSQVVVESDIKIEEVPKKSYAKIVIELKENAATFSPPPASASRKTVITNVEKVNPSPAPVSNDTDGSVSFEAVNNQEAEAAEGYSIYIKGLPYSTTAASLADEFKKFGHIKQGGIQVRNNRPHGFCFGFVEFEEASAVQKAIQASPMLIGGRQAVIEEKRSTNSRGNNRRFLPGRGGFRNEGPVFRNEGSGFRNEGGSRGRGNYGSGRGGYNRDFNGRIEFGNRGGNRGGSLNRGGGGGGDASYQRVENGGRVKRAVGGGMPNGNAKTMAPRVSATA